jgi:4-diphosphocytidyl-2-C-methyl-D-erythritol kinase
VSGGRTAVYELARAKVNLTLEVLGKRSDGYHELSSLVGFADLGDTLTLMHGKTWKLTCSGPTALAIEGRNIVDLAAAAVASRWPQMRTGHVELFKLLPVFAGIGGGSANAAAALRALRRFNVDHVGADDADWLAIAQKLGADVPVCMVSRLAAMRGIGEQLDVFETRHELPAVLVNPAFPVPTAAVFAEFAARPLPAGFASQPIQEPASTDELLQAVMSSRNDLEAPAIRLAPIIGDVLASLTATSGCQLARMSGSGSTCFGLYETTTSAEAAAEEIARKWPAWWVRATVLS